MMISQSTLQERQLWTRDQLAAAGIRVSTSEVPRIEVADFGLDDLDHFGLQLLTYVNTTRVCAKELVLRPWQICPEHLHPPVDGHAGKEETFRCRAGEVFVYVPGTTTPEPRHRLRPGDTEVLTARCEVLLRPGDQYTVMPETLHWFQAGPQGAIVSEFSTRSTDEHDRFTDPRIVRIPRIAP